MRKLPVYLLALLSLSSCQCIPACLCNNPFAAKVVEDVVECIEEEVEEELNCPEKPECLKNECPKDLKAVKA